MCTLGSTIIHFTGCSAVGSPGTQFSNFQFPANNNNNNIRACRVSNVVRNVMLMHTQKTEWISESNSADNAVPEWKKKRLFRFFDLAFILGSIWWIKTNLPPFRWMNGRHTFIHSPKRPKTSQDWESKTEEWTIDQSSNYAMEYKFLAFSSHRIWCFRSCVRKGKIIQEWNEWEVHSFCVYWLTFTRSVPRLSVPVFARSLPFALHVALTFSANAHCSNAFWQGAQPTQYLKCIASTLIRVDLGPAQRQQDWCEHICQREKEE